VREISDSLLGHIVMSNGTPQVGLAINSTEHFAVTTQGTDLLLSVVAGPAAAGSSRSIPPLASAGGHRAL
jgi:hypothetical protein